ncbi:MAG: NAD(P)-binding domain-containing protein [Candidatus Dormibacteraeota bacterium]|nr:NAD(P)-binding domain-containing protein [Candidatus Dormibacteraeota bacterium]
MQYGVLGTGVVGLTLGGRLIELGHEVRLGSRSADNEKASAWSAANGDRASHGTFSEAAEFGERVVNATSGAASIEALRLAGAEALRGKVLIDLANALDFSQGFPPVAGIALDDSLGERIQREFPEARVVKTLNTINVAVTVDPGSLPAEHAMFLCGDDATAKEEVRSLLLELGFAPGGIVDLGGIAQARGTELYVALWVRLMGLFGDARFNISIVRA